MSDELNLIRDQLIFKIGQLAGEMGLSKSMGQLYAALYFSREAVSLNDLAKACRMSKGSASINIRRLEKWGAVRKVWGNSGRKDYYEANRDILSFAASHAMKVFSDILEKSIVMLAEAKQQINEYNGADSDGDDKKAAIAYKKNLQELERLIKKLKSWSANLTLLGQFTKGR